MEYRGAKGKKYADYRDNHKQRQNNLTGRFKHCMFVTPSLSRPLLMMFIGKGRDISPKGGE